MKFRFPAGEITLTHASRKGLMQDIAARLRQDQGFALATLNLDHLVKLESDPSFLAAYQAHDMVVADGNPIMWMSKLARSPVELIPGSDMVLPLARLVRDHDRGLALLGSTPEALALAAASLQAQVPGLRITAQLAPPMGFDPEGPQAEALLHQVADSGAALCFLALGAPKQERLAALGRKIAPQVGFASIGAGLDFLAGSQVRAPQWMRRLALEWLWRLAQSPKRMIPRYAACAAILPKQMWRAGRTGLGKG